MTMESPVRFVGDSEARMWPPAEAVAPSSGNLPVCDLDYLLKGNDFHTNMRDKAPNRSGSAPPSMEGSLAALGSFNGLHQSSFNNPLSGTNAEVYEPEEQLRADPSYIAYYLSNVNMNPRLPPPLKSRENRHLVHHIGHSGGNWRLASFKNNSKGYLLSPQSPLSTHKEEAEDDRSPTSDSSSFGEKSSGFLSHRHLSSEGWNNSFVELFQEDFLHKSPPVFSSHSQLLSHGLVEVAGSDLEFNLPQDSSITASELPKLDLRTGNSSQVMHSAEQVQDSDLSATSTCRISSSLGFHDYHVGPKQESKMERISSVNSADGSHISKMAAEMKSLNISAEQRSQHSKQCFQKNNSRPQANAIELHASQTHALPQSHAAYKSCNFMDQFSRVQAKLSPSADARPELQQTEFSVPLFGGSTSYVNSGNDHYPNLRPSSLFSPQYSIGNYPINASIAPPVFAAYPNPGHYPGPMALENPFNLNIDGSGRNVAAGIDWQQMCKLYGQAGIPAQPTFMDPLYLNCIQQPSPDANAVAGLYDSMTPNFSSQKGLSLVLYPGGQLPSYLGSGASIPDTTKAGLLSPNYYGNPQNMGISIQYPLSSFGSPQLTGPSAVGTALSIKRNDNTRLPVSSSRDTGSHSTWQGQKRRERVDDPKTFSFLEELKSSKTRRFVLSDIVGRIVEFSTDQHGSRFIQQKLENCTPEEKACVFGEVLRHASLLMTDVFGNYVIQKFFEHGNAEERKELASKLVGHVLPLSLQMYGCRVIQKALEVIDDEQRTLLVQELDGHVMHCVRDQNGNHVIQKCIECVPTQRIGFIISAFQGQVAILSTHPYGCRVIQRVLEYCTDKLLSQSIADEILQSACFLAQDQYGNYVTQHVLEKGKPQERSQIIKKLVGQIVQMSHNKFASNVIEKCLEYGDYVERDLLIEEILGQTKENENLLVMMKDQYANYVIQKILETCSDKQRENLLTRIKIHVEALKKYTYGKHIVARVEQLLNEENYAASV